MKIERCISVLLTGFLIPVISWADTINMGYFNVRPYMYSDGYKAKGSAVVYFETLAEKMGAEVTWTGDLPFPRLLRNLEEGRIDGAMMLSITPERRKYLYFSEKPVTRLQTVILVNRDSPINDNFTASDLSGQRIGFLKGAFLSPWMSKHQDRFIIELNHDTYWISQNIQKVLKGQLYAAYDVNPLALINEAENMGVRDRIRILEVPEPPIHPYVAFSKNSPRGHEFLKRYNEVAKSFIMPFDDFNGEDPPSPGLQ